MKNNRLDLIDISIVLITFHPNISILKATLDNLTKSEINVCIVDNSTNEESQISINKIINNHIKLITLNDNIGIAAAQNIGMNWAFKSGYKAVLLMDQDSQFSSEMLIGLCDSFNYLIKENYKVGCIGPLAYDVDVGKSEIYSYASMGVSSNDVVEVDKTLSSGSLISKEAYDHVGGMDEKLFIDLVDWEWCWRANHKGYKIFVDKNLLMPHKLGEGSRKVLFNIRVGQPAPFRHYYQFRNYVILVKRNYIPKSYKIKYFFINTLKFIYFGVLISPRLTRIKYMLKGAMDGIRMKQ